MNETKLDTIAQLQDFLKATPEASFGGIGEKDGNQRYEHISRVLKRFDYPAWSKYPSKPISRNSPAPIPRSTQTF